MFRHATRPRDEMKTWVDAGSPEGVLEAARYPVYRVWERDDGTLWISGIEFASLKKDSPVWLTFRNPFRELAVLAPADLALGELTIKELSRFLDQAV